MSLQLKTGLGLLEALSHSNPPHSLGLLSLEIFQLRRPNLLKNEHRACYHLLNSEL
jgi:hypothetical protein